MSIRAVLSIMVYMVAGDFSLASAGEIEERKDLIRAIFANWQARQAEVKTLSAAAKVNTFYPKGYLSEYRLFSMDNKKDKSIIPESDRYFANEPCCWEIDFINQRVRKEYELTKPWFHEDYSELALDYGLHLYANGKYRFFRPKERYPHKAKERILTPDVVLYENASHQFLLSFSDLPLLWIGGGVSGKDSLPSRMNYLENAARFSYRGEAQWKNHNCVVLSTQEQESKTAVREFWVGVEKEHPIYFCRARDGDEVNWQIEVDYRNQGAHLIPAAWIYTEYVPLSRSFAKETYTTQHININAALGADLFEKKLEPGMVGYLVEKDMPVKVDRDGGFIPLEAGKARSYSLILWGTVAFALTIGVYYVWRRVYRRRVLRS